MNVRRVSLLEGARTASGIAVVIDVFRAFTTAAFCIAAGAREIVLVRDPEEAVSTHEDQECAAYIEALLAGRAVERPTWIDPVWVPDRGWPDWFPRRDAELALEVDRFDFALPVQRKDGVLIARPAWIAETT